jgi:hypothetical protein
MPHFFFIIGPCDWDSLWQACLILNETPRTRILTKKLIVALLVQWFLTSFGNGQLMFVFTRSHFLYQLLPKWIQGFLPRYNIRIHCNIILLIMHRPSKWSLPFTSSKQNVAYIFASPTRATCPPTACSLIWSFCKKYIYYNPWRDLNFLHSAFTSSLFSPNVLISILFANKLICVVPFKSHENRKLLT